MPWSPAEEVRWGAEGAVRRFGEVCEGVKFVMMCPTFVFPQNVQDQKKVTVFVV